MLDSKFLTLREVPVSLFPPQLAPYLVTVKPSCREPAPQFIAYFSCDHDGAQEMEAVTLVGDDCASFCVCIVVGDDETLLYVPCILAPSTMWRRRSSHYVSFKRSQFRSDPSRSEFAFVDTSLFHSYAHIGMTCALPSPIFLRCRSIFLPQLAIALSELRSMLKEMLGCWLRSINLEKSVSTLYAKYTWAEI